MISLFILIIYSIFYTILSRKNEEIEMKEENATKDVLDYLLKQNKDTFLSIIEQTTGLGKTHAIIQKVSEVLKQSKDSELQPKIFVITSGIKTRNEFFHGLKEKLPDFENKILLFESVADQVANFLRSLLLRIS